MKRLLELLESKGLPRTYRGWMLYDPVDKASADVTKKAVSDLAAGVKKAKSAILSELKSAPKGETRAFSDKVDGELLSRAWRKHVKPVFDDKKYKNVGFSEPEPRVIAGQALIDTIKGFYGIKGFTNLGDYI